MGLHFSGTDFSLICGTARVRMHFSGTMGSNFALFLKFEWTSLVRTSLLLWVLTNL